MSGSQVQAGLGMINLASVSDLMRIKEIAREVYASFVPRFSGKPPEPIIRDYAEQVTRRRLYVYHQPDIRGFIVCSPDGQDYKIDNVVVLPKFQRGGIGRQLLTFAEKKALEAGCHRLAVSTHLAMHESNAFYRQHGFEVVDQREDDEGNERVFFEMGVSR